MIFFLYFSCTEAEISTSAALTTHFYNSIHDYLYSAFYDTIVAKQLYRKLRFYQKCWTICSLFIEDAGQPPSSALQ